MVMNEQEVLDAALRGERPHFYDDPAIDQLFAMMIELHVQLSVTRDRLDTVERILEQKGSVSQADIEAYQATEQVSAARAARRHEDLANLFRVVQKNK